MSGNFNDLLAAALKGDSQNSVDLLAYAWNRANSASEKFKAATVVWEKTAERNGHPLTLLQSARLFGKADQTEVEISCLDCLAGFDIAPAQHIRAAFFYEQGEFEKAAELSTKASELKYDVGKSLSYLIKSKATAQPFGAYFWLTSRFYYKRAFFFMQKDGYTDFSKAWFGNHFDYDHWKLEDHSEILLAVPLQASS